MKKLFNSLNGRRINAVHRKYLFEVTLSDGTTKLYEQAAESVSAALGLLQGRLRAAGINYTMILEAE